ncbi:MAG: hypothetical protein DHS20C10_00930 [marine bacterium B5-7]|nr:MAG: hypothetical protein DHS20C10_00930 [marine bacterium B5-7]
MKDIFEYCENLLPKDTTDILPNMPQIPPQFRYWFRGHANSQWNLTPTLFRSPEQSGQEGFLEKQLVTSFKLNHPEHAKDAQVFDTLSVMQHYQYPTRLLDWSSNIMVATFFACSDESNDNHDAAIWKLDPFSLSSSASLARSDMGIALQDYFDVRFRALQAVSENTEELIVEHAKLLTDSHELPDTLKSNNRYNLSEVVSKLEYLCTNGTVKNKLQLPIPVEPGNLNPRISAQRGKFTLFSGKHYFKRDEENKYRFAEPLPLTHTEHVEKLIIPATSKERIRTQLRNILGIDESSLMLDLDSHGRVAKNVYKYTRP